MHILHVCVPKNIVCVHCGIVLFCIARDFSQFCSMTECLCHFQIVLGQLYYQGGRGVEVNHEMAHHYFVTAAESGSGNAHAYLGKVGVCHITLVAIVYVRLKTLITEVNGCQEWNCLELSC